MALTFSKEERLCSRRLINRLYAEGNRLMAFPFSVQWHFEQLEVPCQIMIVAPKRRFHHAVDRNRVKRLTRECYRLHKARLYSFLEENKIEGITLSLVYVDSSILSFDTLMKKMDKLIEQLIKDIANAKGLPADA